MTESIATSRKAAALDAAAASPGLFLRAVEGFLLALFHLTRLLARFIPPGLLRALYMSVGMAAYYVLPAIRVRLREKIAEAMPDISGKREIDRIGRRSCCALVMPSLEMLLLWRHGDRFMLNLQVQGMEHLEKADALGRGVILAGLHQGANALRIAVMSRLGRPYTPIFLDPAASPVARYYVTLAKFGRDLGCDREAPVFWTGQDTVRRVREHLEKGKRVGIDIDVPGRCRVDFFGRPAGLAEGIARFSVDTGAPIVPFQLLQGKRALEHVLIIHPPIAYEVSGDPKKDVETIMGEVAGAAEMMIRGNPGQWMSWFGIRGMWECAGPPAEGDR